MNESCHTHENSCATTPTYNSLFWSLIRKPSILTVKSVAVCCSVLQCAAVCCSEASILIVCTRGYFRISIQVNMGLGRGEIKLGRGGGLGGVHNMRAPESYSHSSSLHGLPARPRQQVYCNTLQYIFSQRDCADESEQRCTYGARLRQQVWKFPLRMLPTWHPAKHKIRISLYLPDKDQIDSIWIWTDEVIEAGFPFRRIVGGEHCQ